MERRPPNTSQRRPLQREPSSNTSSVTKMAGNYPHLYAGRPSVQSRGNLPAANKAGNHRPLCGPKQRLLSGFGNSLGSTMVYTTCVGNWPRQRTGYAFRRALQQPLHSLHTGGSCSHHWRTQLQNLVDKVTHQETWRGHTEARQSSPSLLGPTASGATGPKQSGRRQHPPWETNGSDASSPHILSTVRPTLGAPGRSGEMLQA